jgi:hypothetical protein
MELPDPLTRAPREPDVGSPEDWKRIERALGFKDFDPLRRERIWRWLDLIDLLYFRHDDIPDVRPANTQRALAAVKRHAVRLFVDLSPSGRLGRDSFLREQPILDPEDAPADRELDELDGWALAFLSIEILPRDKRLSLLEGLAELISAADSMIAEVPNDKGGRAKDWRIKGAIHELGRLYKEMSGKEPGISRDPVTREPGGPFFRFVKACLQTYSPERVKSDEALAKTIQRVLRIKSWQRRIAL